MDLQNARNVYSNVVAVCAYVLILAWMILIFSMSAQPGDVSGDISGGVSHLFMKLWNVVFFQGWNEAELLHMAEIWDYPIRKLAHMTEFGILAMLIYWGLGQRVDFVAGKSFFQRICERLRAWFSTYTRYVVAWFFTVIYAATDEIHQLFVPDRSGNALDVCVDATGALLALLLVSGILRLMEVYKRKIQAKKYNRRF